MRKPDLQAFKFDREVSPIVVEDTQLREPNLWVPGKKPVGPVKINWGDYLTDGLLSYHIFNSGNGLQDLVTNKLAIRNGNASVGVKDGVVGLINDGTNGGVTFPSLGDKLYGTAHMTWIIGVIEYDTDGDWDSLFQQNDSPSALWAIQRYASSGYYMISARDTENNAYKQIGSLILNTVSVIAGVFDGTLGGTPSPNFDRIKLYQDGVEKTYTEWGYTSPGATITAQTTNINIGNVNSTNTILFAAIWDKSFTAQEVADFTKDPYQFLVPA